MWMPSFLARLISKFAAEPIKQTNMELPEIKKLPLDKSQYYQAEYNKTHIFLHHTAGGSAASSVAHWASNAEHVATAYIIDRDGAIYETFDPEGWSYHLGVKGLTSLEKASIGIEICSYGALDEQGYTYTGRKIEQFDRVSVDFRGQKLWEKYTVEQIASLKKLLPYLMDKFNIPKQPVTANFWEYSDPAKLVPGIWSHSTVRKDKIDIFPQKELVDLVYNL